MYGAATAEYRARTSRVFDSIHILHGQYANMVRVQAAIRSRHLCSTMAPHRIFEETSRLRRAAKHLPSSCQRLQQLCRQTCFRAAAKSLHAGEIPPSTGRLDVGPFGVAPLGPLGDGLVQQLAIHRLREVVVHSRCEALRRGGGGLVTFWR
jgi:hypothetical protein